MQYKVSVIIPVYNAEKYLRECFDSLVNQTIKDIQIIAVDDGSKDTSVDICKEYRDKYDNFEYYCKENNGPASARNFGLEYAKGEYIGFVDSDDWIELDMYEVLYNVAIDNENVDIVFARSFEDECPGSYEYYQPRGGYYCREDIEKEIFPYTLPFVTNKGNFRSIRWSNGMRIFKKELIDKNHIRSYECSKIAEDLSFTLECTINANSFYYYDKVSFYHQRARSDSITKVYHNNFWDSMSSLIKHFKFIINKYECMKIEPFVSNAMFYFVTTVMWNEKKVTNLFERSNKIKRILNDPLCKEIIDGVNSNGMNKEYISWYNLIKKQNTRGIIWFMWKTNFKKRTFSPVLNKALLNPTIQKMYFKVRGYNNVE